MALRVRENTTKNISRITQNSDLLFNSDDGMTSIEVYWIICNSNFAENVRNHDISQSIHFCISGNSEKHYHHLLLQLSIPPSFWSESRKSLLVRSVQGGWRQTDHNDSPHLLPHRDTQSLMVTTWTWGRHFPQMKCPCPHWKTSQPPLNFSKQI